MVSGLSSDSYAGLVFWDSDAWMYPTLLCLFPEYAMSINNYRTRLLPQAIENAQSYNYSGSLFPWTSARYGNCTATGLCKDYQYHLDHEIAQAHWNYFLHTKDRSWLEKKGWPLIKSVADMFANYVMKNDTTGKFETKLLGEPDEFAYNINNGAYTNAGIKRLLGEWAPGAAKELGLSTPRNWSLISDNMKIPYETKENIIIEFDGMDGNVHIKQASVTLINYPLGWNFNERQAQNDMAFYSAANSPDGPAMTWSMFAISEAQLQEQGCAAYTYLLRGSQPYTRGPYYQFSEQISDNWYENGGTHSAFPFLTGYGGYLQVYIYGFGGFRPKIDALFLDPVMVPQLPEGIHIEGLKYQGGVFDIDIGLEITKIERPASKNENKAPITVRIGGKSSEPGDHPLMVGSSLVVPTRRPDLNGTVILGNLAQCQHVKSNDPVVSGNLPLAAVDGSISTFWQPLTPSPASIIIDLGQVKTINGISINWGMAPARSLHVFLEYEDPNKSSLEVFRTHQIDISQQYIPEDASLIKIRAGNETSISFSRNYDTRFVRVVVEGTQGRQAAWKVAYFRGIVSAKSTAVKGAMMAVALSVKDLETYMERVNNDIPGEMIIACYNSPKNNTISGDDVKIDALKSTLDNDGIFAKKLNVSNAYHSSHMKAVAIEYLELMGDLSMEVKASETKVHMFSSVSGVCTEECLLKAQYWVDNMTSPVKFTEALTSMCFSRVSKGQASLRMNASAGNVFSDYIMEIGPHTTLQGAIKETVANNPGGSSISYLGVLKRNNPGLDTLLDSVASLYSRGSPIDILAVNLSPRVKLIPKMIASLPPYSFNHSEKFMYESRLSRNYRLREFPRHDLFGAPVADWNPATPKWRHILRISEQPWLRDHIVTDSFVFPGVGYIISVVEASRQIADSTRKMNGFRLRDISLKRALLVPDNKEGVEISLSLTRMDESSLWGSAVWKRFQISSYNPIGDDWLEHCTGYIATDYEVVSGPIDNDREARAEVLRWEEQWKAANERCVVPVDIDGTYDNLVTAGLMFGPLFKNLSNVKGTTDRIGEVIGTITTPDIVSVMPKKFAHPHLIHPATMDSMMHFFIASVIDQTGKNTLERAMVCQNFCSKLL
ncbi:beta-ketoacyl synthase domain-containing protein [Phlyctema vagabunda]|uniref:Beta-ketoacyl synthase domain-containing protein n=1 Tax=Phlyctema vagabunda TaxID=108571 RepID=A0ABR4PUA2_9HELO